MEHSLDDLLDAIRKADEQGEPSAIFGILSEKIIWTNAVSIFHEPELQVSYGPTLLQGIAQSFDYLHDLRSAVTLILEVLNTTSESLVYNSAQEAALRSVSRINMEQAKQVYTTLENRYKRAIIDENLFIAIKALEGAVMLCLYRDEDGLLFRAMGLLLTEFPSIPEDPYDPAYLPVKALHLLGRCYDKNPESSGIVQKIEEHAGIVNIAVATEARFNLGIVRLYDAFRSSDIKIFLNALMAARDSFQIAFQTEENRTDAELFMAICECYLAILTNTQANDLLKIIRRAEGILITRLLLMGEDSLPWTANVEFNLVKLLTNFGIWADQLNKATQWPDIKPPMSLLASAYSAIRKYDAMEGLVSEASKAGISMVMLPQIASQFVRVQEIEAKLTNVLADQVWRQSATTAEIAFYELVLQEISRSSSPKVNAASQLEQVRAAAETSDPELAQKITQLITAGYETSDVLFSLAWERINKSDPYDELGVANSAVRDILDKLLTDLNQKLGWELNSPKWMFLKHAVRKSVNYVYGLFISKCEDETKFLFAKPNGVGTDVTEDDLENHFYKVMRFSDPSVIVERQPQGIAPGRPDLGFRFSDNTIFPIEIKCEKADISRQNLHDSYLVQAQSYAAGQSQIGFLFVLDVTPKQLGKPLKNIADYCYVDHHHLPDAQFHNHVIVMIVPANRITPSAHSWQRKKTKRS